MGSVWAEGHTAVVTAVNVTEGYGTINILEQNMDGGNGTNTLAVRRNVVEPDYDMVVTGWLQAIARPAFAAVSGTFPAYRQPISSMDGGFNHSGPGAWHKTGNARFRVELKRGRTPKAMTSPYEGNGFAVTRTTSSGGGIYQDVAFPVTTGDSFCADAEVVSSGRFFRGRGDHESVVIG